MLRTHEGKSVLSEKKNQICDFRCNQMPFTGQIKEIAPYVSAYFWVTVLYKHMIYTYICIVFIKETL